MSDNKGQLDYNRLVLTHKRELTKYAAWLCRDKAMAKDILQETYLRAWKSLDKLKEVTSSKAWLFTILRNENARQYVRYRPTMVDIEVDNFSGFGTGDHTTPEAFALKQALSKLDDIYLEPLLLQVLNGLSIKEISVELDLTDSAVMTRLFRAKRKLKAMLGPRRD